MARIGHRAFWMGSIAAATEEVIAILTQHTFIKDANIHRTITPAAIDPDGRMSLEGLRNDLVYFKEQKLIQDAAIDVERIIDTSFAERAAKELGPYTPRAKQIVRRLWPEVRRAGPCPATSLRSYRS